MGLNTIYHAMFPKGRRLGSSAYFCLVPYNSVLYVIINLINIHSSGKVTANILMALLSGEESLFCFIFLLVLTTVGSAVAQSVEALRYKSEGRGFDSRCHWNFSLT